MKQSLVALAILGAFTGVASAATSVTLYGRADVGYSRDTGDAATNKGVRQDATAGQVRLGIKGEEDLGNGLAATFQLEGRFNGDTGDKTTGLAFFDRESTVGLKGKFGHVRVGRSLAPMERGIGFINVGNRSADINPYSSATRYSNGLFYDYSVGGFSAGAALTTKGGAVGNTAEGVSGTKASYGAYLGYKTGGLRLGAAYQQDNSTAPDNLVTLTASNKSEWGVGASYVWAPVVMGASYAQGKHDSSGRKSKFMQAYLGMYLTPNDVVGIRAVSRKAVTGGTTNVNVLSYGLGYTHNFSKRTSVYANLIKTDFKTHPLFTDKSRVTWDLALRHNF